MYRTSTRLLVPATLVLGMLGGFYLNSAIRPVQAEPRVPPAIPAELTSYRDVVKTVVPTVVSIEAKAKSRRPRVREDSRTIELGFGSGFIVDPKGIVLTNYHVIEGADFAEVRLADGRKLVSQDFLVDKKTDLAVIRLQPERLLPSISFGDSDRMEVGDRVLAVGAPFGLTGSVTQGIISAKSRNLKLNLYEDFLQTDAAINPGNSGGPLVNLEGQVIGVASAIKSKSGGFQGVGLAISSNLARKVMTQLLKDGTVRRGYLGVQIRDVDLEAAQRLNVEENGGVLITRVFPESPGAKAGLKVGDVVLTIGGKPVREGGELQEVVASLPLGQPVEVSLVRSGEARTTRVVIEEQPSEYGLTQRDPSE